MSDEPNRSAAELAAWRWAKRRRAAERAARERADTAAWVAEMADQLGKERS